MVKRDRHVLLVAAWCGENQPSIEEYIAAPAYITEGAQIGKAMLVEPCFEFLALAYNERKGQNSIAPLMV